MFPDFIPGPHDRMMIATAILHARHVRGAIITNYPDKTAELAIKDADALLKKLAEIPFPLLNKPPE